MDVAFELIKTPLSWGLLLVGVVVWVFNRERIRKTLKVRVIHTYILSIPGLFQCKYK